MPVSRRALVVAFVYLSSFYLSSFAAAQLSDQAAAERVLGPQWKQLARRAGMIFAGTVLAVAPPTAASDRALPSNQLTNQLSFRVDQAIAGVERGQTLTIHEWAGAWSMHRPMSKGQHFLMFLYPLSRLGLTSPVGGSRGQVALDASGQNVPKDMEEPDAPKLAAAMAIAPRKESPSQPGAPLGAANISVVQLARAIRGARGE